jgi:iron uptake system component EfeO
MLVGLAISLPLAACGSSQGAGQQAKPLAPREEREVAASLAAYQSQITYDMVNLVAWTNQLMAAIREGDLHAAKLRYASARVWLGRIEPVVASLPNLEARVDPAPGDVGPTQFGGFHQIERALWLEGTTDNLKPELRRFHVDMEALRPAVEEFEADPRKLATDAVAILEGVSETELRGLAEPYSHVDLVDAAAKVEGVQLAFEALKPLIKTTALVRNVDASFDRVEKSLQSFERETPRGERVSERATFLAYKQLSSGQVEKLRAEVDHLAGLCADLTKQL